MTWWRHIITGPDNATVSIGRVLGLIVFALFVIVVPVAAMLSLIKGWVPASEWGLLFDKLTVYLPALLLSIAGMVGFTAPSDPHGPRPFPPGDNP
jgi:ABC-type transport system involved in multi-copper enzyme maturation permease subunit